MTLVRHIRSQQELNEVFASSAPLVLVDVYADWCGPCKILAPHLERIAVDYQSQSVVVCKVNTEEMQLDNINSLPTVQFWALKNGQRQLVHTVVGANLQAILDGIRIIMGTNPTQNFTNPVPPQKKNARGRMYATYGSL